MKGLKLGLTICGVLAVLTTTFLLSASSQTPGNNLVSKWVSTPPSVDGEIDPVWEETTPITIQVAGGANMGKTEVTLKSLYTDDTIFFLAQWADPTKSLERFPWEKQPDGSWKQLQTKKKEHDENTYYEDKLSFIWNIDDSIKGFNQNGCFVTCHAGEAGKAYGNKYTADPGEMGDIWHWKSVRTNPVNQVDDQYLDSTRYDPEKSPEAGRHGDPKEGGGYKSNVNEAGDAPAFTSPTQPAPPYWILDDEKQPFKDTYNPGDKIAGIIVSPFVGDRGDIVGKGVYKDGKWTVEIARKLVTGSKYDVQFSDTAKKYYFGVAVFDNAQVRHAFSMGAYSLEFGPRPATAVSPEGKLETTWGRVKSK
jgi:hypothetical protein